MQYINPYELLGIDTDDIAILKKAKNKLLAEIELSDSQTIDYHGFELTRSDCINAIDELDNKDKREFHLFIHQHGRLLKFLTDGDLDLFYNFRVESIYKLPAFLDFISQYFAEKYDEALLNNFKQKNLNSLSQIVSVKPIVNETYFEKCFQRVYLYLNNINTEINQLKQDIKNGNSKFIKKEFEGLAELIKTKVDTSALNILPIYFQGIRNKLADSINYLSTVTFNEPYYCIKPAFQLMEIAKSITTDSLTEQTINKDYFIVKNALDRDRDNNARNIISQKCISIINQIVAQLEKIEKNETTGSQVNFWVNSSIETSYINSLDSSYQDEKNQIALGLKALSVAVWNKLDELKFSSDILSKALSISTTEPVLSDLKSAKSKLDEIKFKQNLPPKNPIIYQQPKRTIPKKQEKDNTGAVFAIFIVIIIIIFAAISHNSSNSNSLNNSYPSYATNSNSNQGDPAIAAPDASPAPAPAPVETKPIYVYKSMVNGNITRCKNVEPKYDYDIDNKLAISVGDNANAVIKLVNMETNRSIRYVYIAKGTSYVIRNIPEGKYYIKIGYGDDWGRKDYESPCEERFITNSLYKKSDKILDFYLVDEGDGHKQIPSYRLSLNVHTTGYSDGNSSTLNSNNISQNDFNNE